jgi:hypothetical protein
MLEKKFALCATKKFNIQTLVLSEKTFLNETKNDDLRRSIVSGKDHPTEKISEFVDLHLRYLVEN